MAFTLPTNLYQSSYSGWDPSSRGGFLNQLQGQVMNPQKWGGDIDYGVADRVGGYFQPAMQATTNAYNTASSSLPAYYSSQLEPRLQATLNKMAGRGLGTGSTPGQEMMGAAAGDVGTNVMGMQAGLQGQKAGALSQLGGAQAGAQTGIINQMLGMGGYGRSNMANLLGQVGTERTSSNPFQPYQAYLNFMQGMM